MRNYRIILYNYALQKGYISKEEIQEYKGAPFVSEYFKKSKLEKKLR